jgi:hypothetical protein
MRALYIAIPLLLSSCTRRVVTAPQTTTDCPRSPSATAVRTDSVPVERITGRFRLVLVDTVNRQLPPNIDTVRLDVPDSAWLAALQEDARRRGFVTKPAGPLRTDSRPYQLRADWREMIWGSCLPVRCNDESPTYFSFRYVEANGVRGEWSNSMSGIVYLADPKTGRRLPPPAGVFCLLPL